MTNTGNSTQFDNSMPTISWVPQGGQIRSCGRIFFGASVTAAAILILLHALVFAYCSVDHLKPEFIVADLVWTLALWVAVAFFFALIDHGGRFREDSRIHLWMRRWAVIQAVLLAILRIISALSECFYPDGRQAVQRNSLYLSMAVCFSTFTFFHILVLRLRLLKTFSPVSVYVGKKKLQSDLDGIPCGMFVASR